MTLLAPWALWFLLVGGGVVALYLLRIRRKRQTVPSLEFWLALAGPLKPRSLFQRLKRWLSLALWLLIVLALVLALGNPVLSLGRIKPQSIAVILDNSASMTAVEDSKEHPTRMTQALAALHDMLDRRPLDDEWLLIEAAREPRVLQAWTRDRRSVRDAADAVQPHRGGSDLPAAVKLARQLLEGKEPRSIVIVSDGAAGQVAELAVGDESIIPVLVGKTDDNLGLSMFRARSHRQQGAHFVHARVVNASMNEVKSQLVLELDGSTIAVEPFTVAAEGAWEKTLAVPAPQGGVLKAAIDRPDALPADNQAWAILEPIRPARVLLVSEPKEAFFFEQAMLAMDPLVDAAASHTVTLAEFEAGSAAKDPFDLTIFNNGAPEKLPASGAFVFVNRWPADVPAKILGELERPVLSVSRRDHPLMQYLNIGAASVAKASEVTLTDRAIVLADASGGAPLVFLIQQPDRAALCLAFDVLQSDLPIRNAFPILLRNAVVNLVAEQSAWIRDQYAVGEPIEPLRPLPPEVDHVLVGRWQKSEIAESPVPVKNGSFRFSDTAAVGPLRIRVGDDAAYAAINLTDERESRIAPPPAPTSAPDKLALTGRLLATVPWLALTILAAGLIGLEWLTYHYRWTE